MSEIALRRGLSRSVACFDARQWGQGDISHGLPPVIGLTWG